jgi:hypothetical protein
VTPPEQLERLGFLLRIGKKQSNHLQSTTQRLSCQRIDRPWVEALNKNPTLSEQLDAFVARFGRLQDTIAGKLIPELLRQTLETPGSTLDNLNRMEKLGLLDSVDDWLEARNLRNRLIHEYMQDPGEFAQALNRALDLGACPRIGAVARECHFESDFSCI